MPSVQVNKFNNSREGWPEDAADENPTDSDSEEDAQAAEEQQGVIAAAQAQAVAGVVATYGHTNAEQEEFIVSLTAEVEALSASLLAAKDDVVTVRGTASVSNDRLGRRLAEVEADWAGRMLNKESEVAEQAAQVRMLQEKLDEADTIAKFPSRKKVHNGLLKDPSRCV